MLRTPSLLRVVATLSVALGCARAQAAVPAAVPAAASAAVPAAASAAASAAAPAQSSRPTPGVAATWAPRRIQYVYRGLTARYSCLGLKNRIEQLLDRLGARDLRVQECGVTDRLILFPSVRVSMQVLVPAAHGKGGATVAAHWRNVRLFPDLYERDSCELIEEFRRTFLPLFTTRNIDMDVTCVPHHHVPGNRLSAEVLFPDLKPAWPE